MQTAAGLVCSPSDLVGFLLCPHLTELELDVARDGLRDPTRDDPELESSSAAA